MAKKTARDNEQDLFMYDEWLLAKKIGVKPRHVVRWRREFGVEGLDFERVRGFESGTVFERIGMTGRGARRAVEAFGLRMSDFAGCELRKAGVQTEVKRMPSNTRLLICERVAAKPVPTKETVFVRDSAAFRIGDEFVAEHDGGVLVKRGGTMLPGEW